MSNEQIICSNPLCTVREDGRCYEGIATAVCPNYGHEPEQESENESADESPESSDDSVENFTQLPSGRALTNVEAAELLSRGDSRVIAIVGAFDSGKTSLIAGLYDLFQDGPIAGIEFTESRTMWEFELACHDSRAVSQRAEAHMNRTPRGDARFFHVSVQENAGAEKVAIALGNRAGEEYLSAMNEHVVAEKFYEIARADTLTMLVDGDKLVDAGSRHNIKHEINMVLEAFKASRVISQGHRLAITLTKFDVLLASPLKDVAMKFYESILSSVKANFSDCFDEIANFEVAAQPKNLECLRGHGVDGLLKYWLSGKQRVIAPVETAHVPTGRRMFARLMPKFDEAADE